MDMHRQLLIRKEDQISRHNRDDDSAIDHFQTLSGFQNKPLQHNAQHGWATGANGSNKINELTGPVLGNSSPELNQEEVEGLSNSHYDSYQHNSNGSSSSGNNRSSGSSSSSGSSHCQVDAAIEGDSHFEFYCFYHIIVNLFEL
jgi:hypothetical protein